MIVLRRDWPDYAAGDPRRLAALGVGELESIAKSDVGASLIVEALAELNQRTTSMEEDA